MFQVSAFFRLISFSLAKKGTKLVVKLSVALIDQ